MVTDEGRHAECARRARAYRALGLRQPDEVHGVGGRELDKPAQRGLPPLSCLKTTVFGQAKAAQTAEEPADSSVRT